MIEKKKIKGSNRGLTFSFNGVGTKLNTGDYYKYIIDAKTSKIYIIPSKNEEGLKVSKKKVGNSIKALLDIRNKKVKDIAGEADYLQVIIYKDKIVVESYVATKSNTFSNMVTAIKRKFKKVVDITDLVSVKKIATNIISENELKMVVGDSDITQSFSVGQTEFTECASLNGLNTSQIFNINKDLDKVIKVVSLFSGAGMLDYSFSKDSKFDIVYAAEIEEGAIETYQANIGNHIHNIDVSTLTKDNLPKANVLIGGPPCKPFSNSNRKMDNRLENHPDSKLILEYIRIAKECDLDMFVIENVPELLTACEGTYFNAVKDALSDKYEITAKILKDCDYGGYTKRRRAFIIGSRIGSISIPAPIYLPDTYHTVRDALCKVDDDWSNINDVTIPRDDTKFRMHFIPQGGNWKDIPVAHRTKGQQDNCYRRLELDKPACTLVNYRKPPIIHPLENRTLNVSEAAALSGLPKEFVFKGNLNSKQQQVGNGVPQALSRIIKEIIKETFEKYKFCY